MRKSWVILCCLCFALPLIAHAAAVNEPQAFFANDPDKIGTVIAALRGEPTAVREMHEFLVGFRLWMNDWKPGVMIGLMIAIGFAWLILPVYGVMWIGGNIRRSIAFVLIAVFLLGFFLRYYLERKKLLTANGAVADTLAGVQEVPIAPRRFLQRYGWIFSSLLLGGWLAHLYFNQTSPASSGIMQMLVWSVLSLAVYLAGWLGFLMFAVFFDVLQLIGFMGALLGMPCLARWSIQFTQRHPSLRTMLNLLIFSALGSMFTARVAPNSYMGKGGSFGGGGGIGKW